MEEDFYRILKSKRNESGFSQAYVGELLGVSMKQYQNYEKNTIPPHDKLKKLNEIFECRFHRIIYEEKVPTEIDDDANDTAAQNELLTERVELLKQQNDRLSQKNDALLRELGKLEQRLSDEQERNKLSQGHARNRAG